MKDLSAESIAYLEGMPDELLSHLSFSMPWQSDTNREYEADPDGFGRDEYGNLTGDGLTRERLQEECWIKFHRNPHINTAVRGLVGRMTGWNFEISSKKWVVQEAIEEIYFDPRNRLYNFMPKWLSRAIIEGELFLSFTVHPDGFIETDFLDPTYLSGRGDNGTGIIFHPNKPNFPLYYLLKRDGTVGEEYEQIPSINIARYPALRAVAKNHKDFMAKYEDRSRKKVYQKLGGYSRFIVAWDRGFMTQRAISHLRTVLEWLNYYELLKKYEIDHKRASGAYLWTFKFTDIKMFRAWLALDDEDRKKTGVMAKKTPGASLFLPPGMELDIANPKLNSISEEDTDILQMITTGLNEPADVTTGSAKGTFASIKASRGPMSDRTSDEISLFDNFLRHDFWGGVFFLKSAVSGFPATIKEKVAVEFSDDGKPKFQDVKRRPEQLIEINYPTSESLDLDTRMKLLGVKHGPIMDALGIPAEEVAKRLGFGNYHRVRLRRATEEKTMPELKSVLDQEAAQEKANANQPAKPAKPAPKNNK